jgi:amidohydrolase
MTSNAPLDPPPSAVAVAERVASRREAIVQWRRHLHRHPELSFGEHRTAQYVIEQLTGMGLEAAQLTPTSVSATIRGSAPGPTVGLRADIDALPIDEETGLPYASEVPGVMHACGHDAHTAMLLGAASILQDLRSSLAGNVRLIFQHGEEVVPGGARDLVAAGAVDDVDSVIACHLYPALRVGQVGVRSGPITANADNFRIVVRGRGGHAAMPHLSVDPIAVAAQIVSALQHIASRRIDPMSPVVVTVTSIVGGDTYNVIPESVELKGTVRTLSATVRQTAHEAIGTIARSIAQAAGGDADVDLDLGYEASNNDPAVTDVVRRTIADLHGDAAVVEIDPLMAGDDFSAYAKLRPASYFFVGTTPEDVERPYGLHHPRFAPDERALQVGASCMSYGAVALLSAMAQADGAELVA